MRSVKNWSTRAPAGTDCRSVARARRVRVGDAVIGFEDAWAGPQCQDLAREVGDFVVLRADGLWAYQLAVVVDDHDAGVTHVVRSADLWIRPRARFTCNVCWVSTRRSTCTYRW